VCPDMLFSHYITLFLSFDTLWLLFAENNSNKFVA